MRIPAPLLLACFLVNANAFGMDPRSVDLSFPALKDELDEGQTDSIKALVERTRNDPSAVFVVDAYTQGLGPRTHLYVVEQNRALRIFQVLAREGVNPGYIVFSVKDHSNIHRNFIAVTHDPAARAVEPLQANQQNPVQTHADFVLNFPSGSAEPINLDQTRLGLFLSTAGQPNRDVVTIEGFTDNVGNRAYNLDLGEMRAMRVFELMVRAGLPAFRVDTRSAGKVGAAEDKPTAEQKQADRRVVIRWVKNEDTAAQAAVAMPGPMPPDPISMPTTTMALNAHASQVPQRPAANQLPGRQKNIAQVAIPAPMDPLPPSPAPVEVPTATEETVDALPPPPAPATKSKIAPVLTPPPGKPIKATLDVIPFAGLLMPSGALADSVKSAPTLGLGVAKPFLISNNREVRINFMISGRSNLEPKNDTLSDPLTINYLHMRLDYVWPRQAFTPVVGGGFGFYKWTSTIAKKGSSLGDSGAGSDISMNLMAGVEYMVSKTLLLGPEFTFSRVGGEFSNSLYSFTVGLRYRIYE